MKAHPMTLRLSVFIRCTAFAMVVFAGTGAMAADPPQNTMRVTLLGTGTPVPSPERFGNSTLVEAGGQKLVFDFGRGVTIRLAQLRIPFGTINAHFLTHFHSDHLNGLPDLWLTGWLRPPYGNRNTPMAIYGPPGLTKLTKGLTDAFVRDIEIRKADEHDPEAGIAFDVHEGAPGVMYDQGGVKVTAFNNDHGPLVVPSYGYKIEYQGHSVVLSGDTRYNAEVVRQATGADLLVHCVTVIPDELLKQFPAYQAVLQHLASPEDAARVFAEAHPKLAVYSHIGLNGNAKEEDLVARTRKIYDGPLVVGQDLMSIEVGAQTKVGPR
ncbi:MBL fold metallo-hydrolase [Beijerinckia sp. GAS462]|nr:MBL fold metallo-hydrolase [Beijerinckia sp. GAS462]